MVIGLSDPCAEGATIVGEETTTKPPGTRNSPGTTSTRQGRFLFFRRENSPAELLKTNSLPVAGVGLRIGTHLAFRSSGGRFFLRKKRNGPGPLRVMPGRFLRP